MERDEWRNIGMGDVAPSPSPSDSDNKASTAAAVDAQAAESRATRKP